MELISNLMLRLKLLWFCFWIDIGLSLRDVKLVFRGIVDRCVGVFMWVLWLVFFWINFLVFEMGSGISGRINMEGVVSLNNIKI